MKDEKPILEKEKINTKIHKPTINYKNSDSLEIDLIEFDDELLRIDFIAKPNLVYDSDWWIEIDAETFIRPTNSNLKLKLVKAVGIPKAPTKYFFSHAHAQKRFSLFFPMPPADTMAIDIVEKEKGGNSYFNFYGISLSKVLTQSLFIEGMILDLN